MDRESQIFEAVGFQGKQTCFSQKPEATFLSVRYQSTIFYICKNLREPQLLYLVPRNANLIGGKCQKTLIRMICLGYRIPIRLISHVVVLIKNLAIAEPH